jgi:large subunit ribosomal protein L15
MSLNLSNLKPAKGSKKAKKRIGRGGKRGSYSGKGMKGQKARSGVSGLTALGFKQTLLRVPKLRGFRSLKPKMAVVNLSDLEKKFNDGDIIGLKQLKRFGLIDSKETSIKVLGNIKISKKFNIVADSYSIPAKAAIEAAGGKAELAQK